MSKKESNDNWRKIREILLRMIRAVFLNSAIKRFLGYLKRPANIIAISTLILAGIGAWYTIKFSNFSEEKWDEQNATKIEIEGYLDFSNIYISDSEKVKSYEMKPGGEDKTKKLGERFFLRNFLFHPFLKLHINNRSQHPISINLIDGLIAWGEIEYGGKFDGTDYYSQDLKIKESMPLYLESQRQEVIMIPICWPITGKLKNEITSLAKNSIHHAKDVVDSYSAISGQWEVVAGDQARYSQVLKEKLFSDMKTQLHCDSMPSCSILVKLYLSDGTYTRRKFNVPLSYMP